MIKKIIKPIDDTFTDVVDDIVGRTTEEAISEFAQITQQEMQEEANQPDDMLKVQEGEFRLVAFRRKEIRSLFHENSWWFSVVDTVDALTDSLDAGAYWRKLKQRLKEEGSNETVTNCHGLKLKAIDGKMRETDCANIETLFRIIQSIPSPKAEPFKKWLAKVGYERILEIQDPEITVKRALHSYKAKGYPDEWVSARIQSMVSRKDVTNEWKNRGIQPGLEYALLTDAISLETFSLKTKDHREYKGLKKSHNLRDHMSPLELALVILGETTTAELARTQNVQGFKENKDVAKLGGKIAGGARKNIEDKIGRPIVTSKNYLPSNKEQKKLDDK